METTYFDMPTNFVSRKSSKVNAHAQQNNPQFHNFSVPLLQIPLFEKKKLEKAAAKKMEEQKVLKQKLKTLGHISPQNEKFPLTYKLFQTKDNKLEDTVFGTSYGNSIKTPQEIKIKGFPKPTLNPFLHEDDVIEGVSTPGHWATKHINFDTVYSKSANHSPRHFMIKQKFTNNKTMNRPSDTDLRTQLITATQACIENSKKHIKPMKAIISSTPNFLSKSGINSLRSFMLSKTPEIKNFRDASENEKSSEGSPVKRIIKSHRSYFKSHGMKRVDDHNHLKQLEGNLPFERVKDPEELVFNITSENIENKPKGIFLKKLSITQFSPLPEEVDDAPEKFPSPIPSSFRLEKQNDLSMSSITNPVLKGSRLNSLAKVFSEALKPSPLLKEKAALGLKKASSEAKFKIVPISWKEKNKIAAKSARFNPFGTNTVKSRISRRNQNLIKREPQRSDRGKQETGAKTQILPCVFKNRSRIAQIRRKLVQFLNTLKKLKLTPREIMKYPKIFSTKPYEKPNSKKFILAVKLERIRVIEEIISDEGKYIIHDFDHIQQTALHWAVKKGSIKIAKLLIGLGADVDAQDIVGRTPLYFAIKNNDIAMFKLLMINRANLWSTDHINLQELTKDNKVIWFYLSKLRKLDITVKLSPPSERESIWQRESFEILRRKYTENQPVENKKEIE